MTFRLLFIWAILMSFNTFSQDEIKRNMYYGNQAYNEGDYESALDYFQSAVDRSPLNFKANYNLANTYHRMNRQDEALEHYNTVVNLAPSSFDKSKVYHNMGNAQMFKQDLDGAIESYKQALRLNPKDAETRYNLAYAMELKRQQQQQNQEQNQNQNQNQNNGENGDNQNQNGENGDGQNNDQQENNDDQNNGDQENNGDKGDEENNQNNNGNNNPTDKQNKEKGDGQSYGSKLSKEQIENILNAYYKREKDLQKKLDKNKRVGYGSPQKKDW